MERDTKAACKNAIERAIAEKFDGRRLPKETAGGVIREYGIERVRYVLSHTVAHKTQEQRISDENKEWAKETAPYSTWETNDMVVNSHPAVLNGFINQARRYIERENILAAQTAGQEQPKENAAENVTELPAQNEEKGIRDSDNEVPDIDAAAIREKPENGEADREADAVEEHAQDTFGQSDQKPELERCGGKNADTLGHGDQKAEQAATDTLGHAVQKSDYEVGDTVTIEGTEFIIEDISDREVQMRDPKLLYPVFRVENRENFERLLAEESPHMEEKEQDTFGHADQKQPTVSETTVYPGDKKRTSL